MFWKSQIYSLGLDRFCYLRWRFLFKLCSPLQVGLLGLARGFITAMIMFNCSVSMIILVLMCWMTGNSSQGAPFFFKWTIYLFVFLQLPGVKTKPFSDDYDISEVCVVFNNVLATLSEIVFIKSFNSVRCFGVSKIFSLSIISNVNKYFYQLMVSNVCMRVQSVVIVIYCFNRGTSIFEYLCRNNLWIDFHKIGRGCYAMCTFWWELILGVSTQPECDI